MVVIWNPNASRAADADNVRRLLTQSSDTRLVETKSAEDAARAVRLAVSQDSLRIIAAGGDGTINSVVNAMMQLPQEQRPILGVLPLGTSNDWCSSLEVPDVMEDAVELALHGAAKWVDIAELQSSHNTRYFANIATGGNSQRVTESITREMKETWGSLCYLRGAIDILADLKTFRTSVSFDGGPANTFDAWNIMIANGKTSGGRLEVAPHAKLDDGLLDIIIIRDGTLMDLAKLTAQQVISTYADSDQVEYRQAKSIRITSEPPLLFSIDGDIVDEQPIVFNNFCTAIAVARF